MTAGDVRVLHVINGLGGIGGGGAEQSLRVQLPALRELGVRSSVVCLMAREGPLAAAIADDGFPVTVLGPGGWPRRLRQLRAAIRAADPDIVHATIYAACMATRLAGVGLDVALVNSLVNTSYDPVRVRELGIARWKHEVVKQADRLTSGRLVTHFHALTEAVRTEAVEVLSIAPERVTVIPRGRAAPAPDQLAEHRRAAARERLGLDPSVPVVVNVGRQDHQKAQDVLIEAFARVRLRHPDALLLIAGREGVASAANRRAIARGGLGGAVRLLGHRDDVPDLLAATDLFAFPSHFEGLGCALIEAMALGVPVVGSDAPAVAEVLGHGRYGRVVPRNDVAGLATALGGLLASPEDRARLGAAGRHRFLEAFQLTTVADDTLAMYRAVASAT